MWREASVPRLRLRLRLGTEVIDRGTRGPRPRYPRSEDLSPRTEGTGCTLPGYTLPGTHTAAVPSYTTGTCRTARQKEALPPWEGLASPRPYGPWLVVSVQSLDFVSTSSRLGPRRHADTQPRVMPANWQAVPMVEVRHGWDTLYYQFPIN